MATTILTVGHGTLGANELTALLGDAGVQQIVDVRRYPGSRRYPWFSREEMPGWLGESGIAYRHAPQLGGRRRSDPDSPNTAWRTEQFAAYADHMATGEFRAGIDALLDDAAERQVAIMCSESLWWRCHRRLVSDHLRLVHDVAVQHLFHDGRTTPHEPLAEAVLVGDHVEYPAAESA